MQMQPHPTHSKHTLTLSPLFNTTHLSLKHTAIVCRLQTHTNVVATTIDAALLWRPQSTKCQMVQPWSHWQRNTTTDTVNQSLESMRLGEQWTENWWKRKWPITKKWDCTCLLGQVLLYFWLLHFDWLIRQPCSVTWPSPTAIYSKGSPFKHSH